MSEYDPSEDCAHRQMTRIWDHDGSLRCDSCHQPPPLALGWLYRCTQTWDGVLPASDFGGVAQRPNTEAHLYELSKPTRDAIARGEYTEEQIEHIWKQKEEVREAILHEEPRTTTPTFTHYNRRAALSNLAIVRFMPINFDFKFEKNWDLPVIEEVDEESFVDRYVPRSLLPLVRPTPPPPPRQTRPIPVASVCDFKACHNCSPRFLAHSWQALDRVVEEPYKQPPQHELDNRPPIRPFPDVVSIISSFDNEEERRTEDAYWCLRNVEGMAHYISLPHMATSEVSLVERPLSAPPAPRSFMYREW